jgi:DNA polymerase (family 10)
LNIAVCGALNAWSGGHRTADEIFQIAMNVEAQAIDVPTGSQDYRPAYYGGVSAVELGVNGVRRVAIDVHAGELQSRIALAYTNASRNSGINNWDVTKRHIDGDTQVRRSFARIRDIAAAMRTALERRDWQVRRQIAAEWDNRRAARAGRDDRRSTAMLGAARRPAPWAAKSAARAVAAACSARRSRRRAGYPAGAVRNGPSGAGFHDRIARPRFRSVLIEAAPTTSSVDNLAIARILGEIGDLLEIKGENPFKIRAYRTASETVTHETRRVADLTAAERLALTGIGKDIAAKIGELVDSGQMRYHRELFEQFPPTILDLLQLQGVGPKTVARLYGDLGIRTLEDLERATRDGRIRGMKGMGAKKEALILKALEEQRRFVGRRLTAEAHDTAAVLVAHLREHAPGADITVVGSVRRGCETCGDLDILAAGAPQSIMDAFTTYRLVERILAHGDTKSSVRIHGGFQADLRLVPRDSLGAASQYFTGSKAHNIALRDRASQRGLKLNEYGLFRVDDDTRIAGETEESIYAALGLAFVPPELREHRGEVDAAHEGRLPHLVQLADLQGDLHCDTTATDGRDSIESMARASRASGLGYLAITDHSRALAMANGLDEHAALAHAASIRAINDRLDGITLLAGIECDIRPDGSMDLADDCLAQLDIVVASLHSALNQEAEQMTDRLLRAIDCPWVDVLGHPLARVILKRDAHRGDMTRVFNRAARAGVALEINAQIDRLDLDDIRARDARARGARLVISSDAHSVAGLGALRWGVTVARRAWLTADDVLNTRPLDAFRASLRSGFARGYSDTGGHG